MIYPDAIPYVDWDIQGNRLVSSFLDPNFAGAFIMFGLFYAHAQAAQQKPSYPLLTLFWVALILTLSRSSIIASLLGLGLLTFRTRQLQPALRAARGHGTDRDAGRRQADRVRRQLSQADAAGAVCLVAAPGWLLAWQVFTDNPLIGVGYNTFGIVRSAYGSAVSGNTAFGSDGGILYLAAVSGIVGVALLGAVLWRIMMLGLATHQTNAAPNVRVLGLTLHAWVPSLVVHSAASNSIFYPFIIGPLFLLGGLCARQYYGGEGA